MLRTEDEAVAFVSNYFGRNKAAYSYTDFPKIEFPKNRPQLKCELVLEFGKYRILVETRFVRASETPHLLGRQVKSRLSNGRATTWQSVFDDLVDEVHEALGLLNLTQGAIVVFVDHDSEVPPDDGFTWVRRSRGFEWGFWNCHRRALVELESVRKYRDGKVHAVVVNLHCKSSVKADAPN